MNFFKWKKCEIWNCTWKRKFTKTTYRVQNLDVIFFHCYPTVDFSFFFSKNFFYLLFHFFDISYFLNDIIRGASSEKNKLCRNVMLARDLFIKINVKKYDKTILWQEMKLFCITEMKLCSFPNFLHKPKSSSTWLSL